MAFNLDDIEALAEMVGAKDQDFEEYKYQKGSVLNPATVDGSKQKEEIAKPNAKIQIKVGQSKEDLKKLEAKKEAKKKEKDPQDIWTDQEVSQHKNLPDDRPQPQFDVLYKQTVGTQDIYLGLSDSDPSSTHCQSLLIKVKLPHAKLSEIGLDIQKQSIHVQSPDYVLNHILPYPVDKDKGKAKFDSDKCELEVSLPVIKKTLLDELI